MAGVFMTNFYLHNVCTHTNIKVCACKYCWHSVNRDASATVYFLKFVSICFNKCHNLVYSEQFKKEKKKYMFNLINLV